MKFAVSPIVAGLLYALGVVAQAADPSVNTPSGVVQCLPIQITFSGTAPPFIVTVQPGGQAGAAALTTIGTTSSNSLTWVANLPAGGQYTLVIRDSQGRTNPSAAFEILPGSSDCLNGSASSVVASTPAASTPAGSATTPATTSVSSIVISSPSSVPVTTIPATSRTTPAGTTTTRTGASVVSSAVTSATATNGASNIQPFGVAGVLGAIGAAVALL